MRRKLIVGLAVGLVAGATAYGGAAVATPSTGVTNPSWSPVIGRFQNGIHAKTKTDIDPSRRKDFWKVNITAKGATDVQVIENIIAPGGSFGWHSHPGPSLVIVKSGTLSVYHGPNCMMEEYGRSSTRVTTCTWCATTPLPWTTSTWSRSSRRASLGASTSRTPTLQSALTEAGAPRAPAAACDQSGRCWCTASSGLGRE